MNRTVYKMMSTATVLLGLASTGALVSCAGGQGKESTGEYVDDVATSTKVRAKILQDPDVKISQIKVTTYKGTVQLSGFVDNQQMAQKAAEIAKTVDGVQSVKNDLVVRKQ
jgi:osmotically-inducible protein OsmY